LITVLIMLWQSLTPVRKYCDLKHNDFLLVIITSTSDGIQHFLKQVGPLTSSDRLNISQKSFKVALLSELSMSKFMSPNNNICS
jgi:hypothetical protein